MTRLTLVTALFLSPVLIADDAYVPFDYSTKFEQKKEKEVDWATDKGGPPPTTDPDIREQVPPVETPHTPDVEEETHSLSVDDIRQMSEQPPVKATEQLPATTPAPSPQRTYPETPLEEGNSAERFQRRPPEDQWGPITPQRPVEERQPETPSGPVVSRYTVDGRPQVYVLTECSLDQRDRHGKFTSSCIPCNQACAALVHIPKFSSGEYTVGEQEYADFRVVPINTQWGYEIDLAMGSDGHTLTEIVGYEDPNGRAYKSATPVFVIRHPDKAPQVIKGWQGGNPHTEEAMWWLLGMIGVTKDNPQTWAFTQGNRDLAALAWWASLGNGYRGDGWGASISAADIADLLRGEGRHPIWGNCDLVIPRGCNPRLQISNARQIILTFAEAPYIEYQKGFLTGKAYLSHVEVAADFSRLNLVARDRQDKFPITVVQGPAQWSRISKEYERRTEQTRSTQLAP